MRIEVRIGRMLQELREERGLTQEDVRKIAKITRTQLSRIENGKGSVRIGNLSAIAEALDITLEALFREISKPKAG